ncbi:MAG: glutamate--tRNA ligase family protein [bacterium]|nr:glutamate--tRNA ligase family protein [bacterium]
MKKSISKNSHGVKSKNQQGSVMTRFAPSPTGVLHIGGARSALFNYLFAKKHGGKFILRIEDTDKERSKKEFEDDIVEGLSWLGLEWDERYRQSERTDVYKKYLKKLVDEGKAYVSKEEVKKEGEREEVIRFRNPGGTVTFDDLIRGEISFDTAELKDFIIAKSLEEPLYHLAVVVDDHESGITHVIRGEDHISNTPRQILLLEAIGAKRPAYAHIPLILAPDRSKLSKRHGAVALTEFKKEGYLPEAMVNYLALLGWNPGGEEELFPMERLVGLFDLGKAQKGGAVFNIEKLKWFNREYLKEGGEGKIKEALEAQGVRATLPLVAALRERINTTHDIARLLEGEFSFVREKPACKKEKLVWKETSASDAAKHLEAIAEKIGSMKKFDAAALTESVMPYAEEHGRGAVLWPFRFALTGKDKSPDPFTVAAIIGKDEALARLGDAVQTLNA